MGNWLSEIKHHRKKIYSQCGEEGFIEFILKNLGVETRGYLIEFGAGDGITLSNSRYFIHEKSFQSTLFDGDPKGNDQVNKAWIDVDWAVGLAKEFNDYVVNPDLFLIDLDGNDWYILDAFLSTIREKPKLVVCEINPIWKRDEARVIAYNPDHVWKNNTYYGMSLKAAEIMMKWHGYSLVFVNDSLNAYFVRTELLPGEPEPVEYRVKKDHPNGSRVWLGENEIDNIRMEQIFKPE